MLVQRSGWPVVDVLSTTWAMLIFLMAASEWRQIREPGYRRIALAAGVVAVSRGVHVVLWWTGPAFTLGPSEWALEGLAVALFAWALFHHLFATDRTALGFLGIGLGAVAVGLLLGLHLEAQGSPAWLAAVPGLAVLWILSGWAFWRWVSQRRQSSLWLGAAFSVSALAATVGLIGFWPVTPWIHLPVLVLLMVETYRTILADWGAYGQGLQSASERTQRQSEEMALLMEVNQAVSASLELPVVLEHACESLARSVAADWAYILLPLKDESEDFQVAARYGWWGRRQKQDTHVYRKVIVRLADFSLLRHAVLRRRLVLANEARDYEQFDRMHDLLGRPQGGPTLIVPIFHRDRSIGVALLGYVEKQRRFTQSDSRLCQALISQVAAAIINARSFQAVEDRAVRLEGALKEEQGERSLRQAILDSLAGGVVVADLSGDLLLANAAAERLLGLSRSEMDRRVWRRLQSEIARKGQERLADQAVFPWKDRVLAASLVPVRTVDKDSEGQALLLCDVTAVHHSRQALEQAVAGLGEEIRVLLSLLEGSGYEPGRAEKLGRQALDLLLDLSALTAPTGGLAGAPVQALSISELVKGVLCDISVQAAAQSVTLVTQIAADLEPVGSDPHLLRRALVHLLEHAVEVTPPGGRVDVWAAEARLQTAAYALQRYVVVNVRDSGSGLTDSELDQVLEPFFKMGPVPTEQRAKPQVNVAIARALVEAQGGQMWVESEMGKGTSFRFSVPVSGA